MARLEEVATTNLPLDSIVLGKYTARFKPDPGYIDQLAESIGIEGQLKPIVVRRDPESEKWELIDGEHRWRAMKKLGKATIRCEVVALSEEEALARAVVINMMHGKPLDKFEVAQAVKKFADRGKSELQIARMFGKSRQWVNFQLSIATRVAEPVQQALATRAVTPAHVREIAELPKDQQTKVAATVVREGLSFKDTERLVHAIKDDPLSADELTSLPKEKLKAELAGMTEVKDKVAAEEFAEALGAKGVEAETRSKCPGCGKPFVINWEEATIEWP